MNSRMAQPASFSAIPAELLYHIFAHVSGKDIVSVLSTSRYLRTTFLHDETIWRELCARYGVHSLESFRLHDPNRTFFTVYTELLHTYGPLIGLWASDNPFNGNILEFRIVTESRAVGWEGIVGEVWRWSDASVDLGDEAIASSITLPTTPDYYECLRIELLASPRLIVDSELDMANETLPKTKERLFTLKSKGKSPSSQSIPKLRSSMLLFTQVAHYEPIGLHRGKPTLRTSSPSCLRLNNPHQQAFYVSCGPPDAGHPSSLHPEFPPTNLMDFAHQADRFPRIAPQSSPPWDMQKYLKRVGWKRAQFSNLFYFAPAEAHCSVLPRSITLIPPPKPPSRYELYDHLLSPQKESSISDIRSEVKKAYLKSGGEPYLGHYFPIPWSSPPLPPPSDVPCSWEPSDLEGLWIGAFTYATTLLYLKTNETDGNLTVQAWKLTGGPCVPRGAVTWDFQTSDVLSPYENVDLLMEMGIKVGGEDGVELSEIRMFNGSGVVSSEGFMEDMRGVLPLTVVVLNRNEMRMRWTYHDGVWMVFGYKRYPGRDLSSESPLNGVRYSAVNLR
ncbi:hypothetical protein BXZ70DRAFT_954155 [Cristinia sonorae]|uniref:F-box domain-containing protein n=1 Tax=Cristinia sonorae TaxID=1940300 RepID=A0A8K0UI47_9AGAR|nr:hypothetical protein BXZ70DRAFT_954155 [Cristinia sonorae]